MSKLLPCRFCGNEKNILIYCHFYTDKTRGFTVFCNAVKNKGHKKGCGASGAWRETEEEAIKVWNARYVSKLCDGLKTWARLGGGDLATRQNAEEVLAAKDAEIAELRRAIMGKKPAPELQQGNFLKIAAALHRACDDESKRAAALEADNKRLREALEPFAEYGEDYFDKDHNGNPLPDEQGVGWIYMNFGNFRKARAALAEVKP